VNMPRILHVTESHAKADGGVTTVVNDLTQHINLLGVYSCILAATDTEEFTPNGVDFVKVGSDCNSISALFSSKFKASVKKIIIEKNINVIHIHGIWRPLQIITSWLAREMGIPFLVTSHGMLEPWLWMGKGWKGYVKKKLYFNWIAYPAYNHARWIHAITPDESASLKRLFPKNQHAVIPNAIDLVDDLETGVGKREKVIFFIGRINPKKGVDLLLKSFRASSLSAPWKLVIAGPEEVPEYANELREFVKRHGLESKIIFIGPVYGKEKEHWYRRSWVTVVPSYSEVVGMVNLEASSLGCPTITTVATGLSDWEDGGGVLIKPAISDLLSAIKEVSLWSDDERERRGMASYNLVKNKYSWEVVGRKWVSLYSELHRERGNNAS